MITRTYRHRVAYSDADQGGIVHHSAYLRFLEAGRIEWLREHGISYRVVEKEWGMGFAVVDARVKYRKPAYFDDVIDVVTTLSRGTIARLIFQSVIKRNDDVLAEGEITLACLDFATGRARAYPAAIQSLYPKT